MNLNQITIYSTDVLKSVEFYKLLGLKIIVDALPRYVRFECPDGDATFSIHEMDTVSKENSIVIYFEDNNLEGLVHQLKEKGITFTQDITEQPWLWKEAHLEDPDGHNIILFSAGENRKNPPWRNN